MSTSTALAEENITVMLNGQAMDFDVAPIIQNDRVLVPMRAIFEGLNRIRKCTYITSVFFRKYIGYFAVCLFFYPFIYHFNTVIVRNRLSISLVVALYFLLMASEGAVGDTKQEITKAFDSPNTSLYSQIITDNK